MTSAWYDIRIGATVYLVICPVSDDDVVSILFLTTVALSILLVVAIFLLVLLLMSYVALKRTTRGRLCAFLWPPYGIYQGRPLYFCPVVSYVRPIE